jgi:hypothetical protein
LSVFFPPPLRGGSSYGHQLKSPRRQLGGGTRPGFCQGFVPVPISILPPSCPRHPRQSRSDFNSNTRWKAIDEIYQICVLWHFSDSKEQRIFVTRFGGLKEKGSNNLAANDPSRRKHPRVDLPCRLFRFVHVTHMFSEQVLREIYID